MSFCIVSYNAASSAVVVGLLPTHPANIWIFIANSVKVILSPIFSLHTFFETFAHNLSSSSFVHVLNHQGHSIWGFHTNCIWFTASSGSRRLGLRRLWTPFPLHFLQNSALQTAPSDLLHALVLLPLVLFSCSFLHTKSKWSNNICTDVFLNWNICISYKTFMENQHLTFHVSNNKKHLLHYLLTTVNCVVISEIKHFTMKPCHIYLLISRGTFYESGKSVPSLTFTISSVMSASSVFISDLPWLKISAVSWRWTLLIIISAFKSLNCPSSVSIFALISRSTKAANPCVASAPAYWTAFPVNSSICSLRCSLQFQLLKNGTELAPFIRRAIATLFAVWKSYLNNGFVHI